MLSRRTLFAAAILSFAAIHAGYAGEEKPFTSASFAAAQNAKQPILVEIHASWCPTCKAQAPILGSLISKPEFMNMAVLKVDFDAQKDIVRQFGAQMQSTLIVFKGDKEVGRSVGDTNPASIAALLGKAI